MSVEIYDALKKMKLYDGLRMRIQVNGWLVTLKVDAEDVKQSQESLPLADAPSEEDLQNVMLDPWVDLSEIHSPGEPVYAIVEMGEHPPPDVPEIPRDEDES